MSGQRTHTATASRRGISRFLPAAVLVGLAVVFGAAAVSSVPFAGSNRLLAWPLVWVLLALGAAGAGAGVLQSRPWAQRVRVAYAIAGLAIGLLATAYFAIVTIGGSDTSGLPVWFAKLTALQSLLVAGVVAMACGAAAWAMHRPF